MKTMFQVGLNGQVSGSPEKRFRIHQSRPNVAEAVSPSSAAPGGTERILVVDDEPGQRFICRKMLERLGYAVTDVVNGHQALSAFEQAKDAEQNSPYDLVVLDMIMEEGFDGLETYKAILKLYPEQKVIIASGDAENERAKEAVGLGAYWLGKPYHKDELGRIVREKLDN